jgi:DNA polymerase-3 subunit chi
MTRIDFYILQDHQSRNRELMACRIAEKAWRQTHKVHIHTGSRAQSQLIDDLLWTFQDGSFIPHEIGSATSELCPISIDHETEPQCHDVLINLASEVPFFFSRFERVSEIIDQDPQCQEAGRERYRFYRDRGYELDTHKIGSTA